MSIISIQNLGLRYGDREIFSGITAELPHGARVGLVGPNGVGKTSLLRIVAGLADQSTGEIHRSRGLRIGYLRQEAVEAFAGHDHSVYEEMLTVFAHLQESAARLQAMEERMADGHVSQDELEAYGHEQESFERQGGYDYDVRIQQTLEGLGFSQPAWGMTMAHLSGGQKTRALLARLVLEEPDLLILDEPTNHLDLEAIAWLEKALQTWKGALIVVSHDRFFLDAVVDRIWEMAPTHIERYRGNYSAYAQQREERWERTRLVYEREMERLEKDMELVRRYHAWRKFEMRDGKLKLLGRRLLTIERYGLLAANDMSWSEVGIRSTRIMEVGEAHRRIKEIRPPAAHPPQLHMTMKPVKRSGDIVLRMNGLEAGYEGKPLFRSDDGMVQRGDRVAIIGPNGSGKTTLLRTLLGQLEPVAGSIELGASVHVGYFAQAHDSLDLGSKLLDEVLRHKDLKPAEARDHLARYLFRGEDVYKLVGDLSGGERARLALALLTLDGVNVLVLDEPTNHLDIYAQEVLQEGLESFPGTLLMVSHDRYLVARLATQVWEIREGRLSIFKGTYKELQESREPRVESGNSPKTVAKQAPRVDNEKVERKRLRMVAALEEQIAEAEAALAKYDSQIASGSFGDDYTEAARLSEASAETQARIEQLLREWETAAVESREG